METQLQFCPKCGGEDITYVRNLHEGDVSLLVECENCGKTWWEVYEFSYNEDADTSAKIPNPVLDK